MTPLPPEPWQLIAANIFRPLPSGEKVLVLKCLRLKWPEVKVFLRGQSTNADGVISAMEKMFGIHSIPDMVLTDNGLLFNSKDFKSFSNIIGFQTQRVTPLWPEAKGQAEAFMKWIVRTAHIENRDWQGALDCFLLAPGDPPSTGVAPAHLTMSWSPLQDYCLVRPPHLLPRLQFQHSTAKQWRRQSGTPIISAIRNLPLTIGDSVLVCQQKRNKLTLYYIPRLYKIVEVNGSIVTAAREGHRIVRNSSFFKQILVATAPSRISVSPNTRQW